MYQLVDPPARSFDVSTCRGGDEVMGRRKTMEKKEMGKKEM